MNLQVQVQVQAQVLQVQVMQVQVQVMQVPKFRKAGLNAMQEPPAGASPPLDAAVRPRSFPGTVGPPTWWLSASTGPLPAGTRARSRNRRPAPTAR